MTTEEIDRRLRRLPRIARARFWRLYAQDGRRFLDLWQDGGRGILGARHKGLGSSIKAALDRGLDRPLPSHYEARLAKAALGLWPGATALRVFGSEATALAALGRATAARGEGEDRGDLLYSSLVHDPARREQDRREATGPRPVLLLRPFRRWLPEAGKREARDYAYAVPLLPLARGLGPTLVLAADPKLAEALGPGELLPPLLLSAAIDALTALARYEAAQTEAGWKRADRRLCRLFERQGPWIYPRPEVGDYDRIFDGALERGLLLSPDRELPSILPADFDDGELAPLASLEP